MYSYGCKGHCVLQQALMAMFGAVGETTNFIKPLSFVQFAEQFLIPFVAVHTISQEFGKSPEDAFKILRESTPTGMQLQPEPEDDDPDLETLHKYNITRSRARRPRNVVGTSNMDDSTDVRPPKFQKQSYPTLLTIVSPIARSNATPGPSNSHTSQPIPARRPSTSSSLSPVPPSPSPMPSGVLIPSVKVGRR